MHCLIKPWTRQMAVPTEDSIRTLYLFTAGNIQRCVDANKRHNRFL